MSLLTIPQHQRPQLDALLQRSEQNLRALELFSRYLNLTPRFVEAQDVRSLCDDCGITEQEAYMLLVAAACGLDDGDRAMEEQYFRHAIKRVDATSCRNDPYYRTIRMPKKKLGTWEMGSKLLHPYEAFTADDLLVMPDGREIPQIGFFNEAFEAPVVFENGREWMTVTPSERNTMLADIDAVSGSVAVFGLGLGYYAFMIAQKHDVKRVVVIERDKNVIALFREYILPQFPNAQKVTVVQADAYEYAAHMAEERFDYAYVDIWHDVLDGVAMYLRMKRMEKRSPGTKFLYWIETSMLCWLRGMALMEVAEGQEGPMLQTFGSIHGVEMLQQAVSLQNLRSIAPLIPQEVTKR